MGFRGVFLEVVHVVFETFMVSVNNFNIIFELELKVRWKGVFLHMQTVKADSKNMVVGKLWGFFQRTFLVENSNLVAKKCADFDVWHRVREVLILDQQLLSARMKNVSR